MIVVADASPRRYLILIEHTHILPALYGRVLIPPIVVSELSQEETPGIVRRWIANRPDWVRVQGPTRELVAADQSLGAGELAAIALAEELQTAWETLRLLAHGVAPRSTRKGAAWNREQLQRIDRRWHDLRREGACRLLADGVDIRIIQLMLGHASIQQTQRYLNVTDEELRRGLEVSWNNKGRPLRLASGA